MCSYIDVSSDQLTAAAELFRALGAPARLTILRELTCGPRCVHELVTATGASQSLVSQHLRVLRGARLVRGERRGREIEYALMDTHIGHLVGDALAHVAETGAPGGDAVPAPGPDEAATPVHEPATTTEEQP
jgi:DNA-binding transcriptional ArsR family regulator